MLRVQHFYFAQWNKFNVRCCGYWFSLSHLALLRIAALSFAYSPFTFLQFAPFLFPHSPFVLQPVSYFLSQITLFHSRMPESPFTSGGFR